MKMYLKIIFRIGIPFGLMMGILQFFIAGVESGIKSSVSVGLFYGLFITVVLGTLQLLGTKKMGSAGNMSPTQSTTVELDSNLDLAFDRCVQALNRLGAKIQSQDKTKFEIKATSRMTWKSWGEELTIRLSDMQNQKVKIEILSSPKLKTTPMDFGKGRENVEKIAKILSR
jgi:hypothetical protein